MANGLAEDGGNDAVGRPLHQPPGTVSPNRLYGKSGRASLLAKRHEIDREPVAGRFGDALQGSQRWP